MPKDETEIPGPLREDAIVEALSDASARSVIATCAEEPRSVKDISDAADIPLASTYRHVRSLVDADILIRARSAISPEGKRYDLYRSRIRRVRMELTPAGLEVDWEVNPEVEERIERLRKEMSY